MVTQTALFPSTDETAVTGLSSCNFDRPRWKSSTTVTNLVSWATRERLSHCFGNFNPSTKSSTPLDMWWPGQLHPQGVQTAQSPLPLIQPPVQEANTTSKISELSSSLFLPPRRSVFPAHAGHVSRLVDVLTSASLCDCMCPSSGLPHVSSCKP